MKKWFGLILAAGLLVGCGGQESTTPPVQEEQTAQEEQMMQEEQKEEEVQEEQESTADAQQPYAAQIAQYRTALEERWEMDAYFENDRSHLPIFYYEENPLEKVGYACIDLDFDGSEELLIGAMQEEDPAIFEVWTLEEDGTPVKLATGHERNRYYLEWMEEGVYMLENQASNGAANSARYYYTLFDGALQVQQAIIFDALADENHPWFMAYDTDWDTSNDTPIDEKLAQDIMDSYTRTQFLPEYTPFSK